MVPAGGARPFRPTPLGGVPRGAMSARGVRCSAGGGARARVVAGVGFPPPPFFFGARKEDALWVFYLLLAVFHVERGPHHIIGRLSGAASGHSAMPRSGSAWRARSRWREARAKRRRQPLERALPVLPDQEGPGPLRGAPSLHARPGSRP